MEAQLLTLLGHIFLICVVVGILLFLYKSGKKDIVRQVVLGLVVKAEKALGSGTGELKYAWVVDELYRKMPALMQLLFTDKDIDNFIKEGVDKLKVYLSKGVTLTGYDEERYLEQANK